MTSTNTAAVLLSNDRAPPQHHNSSHPAPIPSIRGTVEFNIVPDATTGTLTLTISERNPDLNPARHLVGVTDSGEYYLRVPEKAVQIDLVLAGPWDWSFLPGDGITIGRNAHASRYWLVPLLSSNQKTRRIIIKQSNGTPVPHLKDDGRNDEKFNLEVQIAQNLTQKRLVIEIDPITKNPPPDGGKIVKAGTAGALL